MTLWTDFGFRESPYATEPIPATSEGEYLLVGRDVELGRLRRSLDSSGLHPTIEGDNGVGKTSLVSVAAYQLTEAFEDGSTDQALIPLRRSFQLTTEDSPDSLTLKVAYEVAKAFIEHHDLLKRGGLKVPDVDAIDRWLNAPLFTQGGLGASAFGFGAEVSRGVEPNTSSGFSESGFVAAIERWLTDCFPSRQSGGFIAVVDNLELLETSQAARSLLESLRDTVLGMQGLRWVLCGARGIVRTAASSPRLEGRLSEPMQLTPVADSEVPVIVQRRIETFRIAKGAVAPVGPEGFRHIYDLLKQNLRNTLKFCEDFSFWLADHPNGFGSTSEDRREWLEVWLSEMADRHLEETALGDRAWEVFDGLAEAGGSMSPSGYGQFDFNSYQAMRPHVKSLEDAKLVVSAVDESDQRRRTINITPRGWLVRYARSGYQMP